MQGITCREIILELEEKLRAKFHYPGERGAEALADLLGLLRPAAITGDLKAVPADPDDDKVIECAVMARATHIVTGDRRHLLPLGQFRGV